MLNKIVVLKCHFQIVYIVRTLVWPQVGASRGRAFKVVPHADFEVFEDVAHNGQVPDLLPPVSVVPLNLVKPVEPNYQAVSVLAHVVVVVSKDFPHLVELPFWDSFHHVLPVLGVVKQTA